MPEEVPKEVVEFLTRFGGATTSALEEFIFDWYWGQHPEARNKFPFVRPLPQLPYVSDLIVFGLPISTWIAGVLVHDDARKKGDSKTAEMSKAIEEFGEGGVLYSGPMLVHHTAVLNAPKKAAVGAPAGGPSGQPAAQVPVVYKL